MTGSGTPWRIIDPVSIMLLFSAYARYDTSQYFYVTVASDGLFLLFCGVLHSILVSAVLTFYERTSSCADLKQ